MAYIVRMPKLGVEMESGVLLSWDVQEGDAVEEGDTLAEIESEKTQAEVIARESGVLRRTVMSVEEEGEPGAPMGIIAGADEAIDELLAEVITDESVEATEEETPADAATPQAGVADPEEPDSGQRDTDPLGDSAGSGGSDRPDAESDVTGHDRAQPWPSPPTHDTDEPGARQHTDRQADIGGSRPRSRQYGGPTRATPKARRLAAELGVDLVSVAGTGPKGAVTVEDVEAATSSDSPEIASTEGDDPGTTGPQRTEPPGAESPTPGETDSPVGTDAEAAGTGPASVEVRASPRARNRADELGVDVATVEGTGPKGSIVEADVERAATAGTGNESDRGPRSGVDGDQGPRTRTVRERREQSRMRSTISRRLGQSWREAPHVTVDRTADAEGLFAAVEAARASGHDVSMTDVILRAVSETLAGHPEFNATFEDGIHTIYHEHNVGIAVDVADGLVTPVIPDVAGKSVDDIAAVRGHLTDLVRSGDHTADDLDGGTFTVSNLGVFGVDSFTPIINPPEVAILGINCVEERPVKGERGGIEFRRQIGFSLSFDHRVVDGADAARFLETLADHLSDAISLVP